MATRCSSSKPRCTARFCWQPARWTAIPALSDRRKYGGAETEYEVQMPPQQVLYSAFGEYSKDHEALMGTTATFWCLKTMSKAGPDEHYVHASICQQGRRCWEAVEE